MMKIMTKYKSIKEVVKGGAHDGTHPQNTAHKKTVL